MRVGVEGELKQQVWKEKSQGLPWPCSSSSSSSRITHRLGQHGAPSNLPPKHGSNMHFLFYTHQHSLRPKVHLAHTHDQDVGAEAGDTAVDQINPGSAVLK